MKATLVVEAESIEGGGGTDEAEMSPGLLYGSALAILAATVIKALRRPAISPEGG